MTVFNVQAKSKLDMRLCQAIAFKLERPLKATRLFCTSLYLHLLPTNLLGTPVLNI